MKKIFILLAVLCCSVWASAQSFTYYGIKYNITSSNTVEVARNAFTGTTLTIPKSVVYNNNTYTVTSIEDLAFAVCADITSVYIPSSVTSIGYQAFINCWDLSSIIVIANTPPTVKQDVFVGIPGPTTVYVPDGRISNYLSSWENELGEIQGSHQYETITVSAYKQPAKDVIDAAMQGIELSEEDLAIVNGYKQTINNATSLTDIETARDDALAYIDAAITLELAKQQAIAAIQEALQGETGTYLTGLVQPYINTILTAPDTGTISMAKSLAVSKLITAVPAYKAGKTDVLGRMGEPQDGPAVRLIDQEDKTLELYNLKKVEFIKAEVTE